MTIKYLLTLILFTLILSSSSTFAQAKDFKWKKLPIAKKDLWYDSVQVKNTFANRCETRVLERFNPLIEVQGIQGQVSKTITTYAIDFDLGMYSIKKIEYLDMTGKSLGAFNYDIEKQIAKNLYSFPITTGSLFLTIADEYKKMSTKSN